MLLPLARTNFVKLVFNVTLLNLILQAHFDDCTFDNSSKPIDRWVNASSKHFD